MLPICLIRFQQFSLSEMRFPEQSQRFRCQVDDELRCEFFDGDFGGQRGASSLVVLVDERR